MADDAHGLPRRLHQFVAGIRLESCDAWYHLCITLNETKQTDLDGVRTLLVMVDAEQFFGQAVARTNPTTMNGLLRLVVECSIYFNEHRDSFNLLTQKLTYVIDALYRRSRGSPSFENKVWAIALLSTAWNGFYRDVRATDDKNEEERKILLNVVVPSLKSVSELAREYADVGIRSARDI